MNLVSSVSSVSAFCRTRHAGEICDGSSSEENFSWHTVEDVTAGFWIWALSDSSTTSFPSEVGVNRKASSWRRIFPLYYRTSFSVKSGSLINRPNLSRHARIFFLVNFFFTTSEYVSCCTLVQNCPTFLLTGVMRRLFSSFSWSSCAPDDRVTNIWMSDKTRVCPRLDGTDVAALAVLLDHGKGWQLCPESCLSLRYSIISERVQVVHWSINLASL